jgi:hypothetical protein
MRSGRGVAAGGPAARKPDGRVRPRVFGLHADPIAEIEDGCRTITDPVAKLRYVRRSLEHYESLDERFQAVPVAPVRWALYKASRLDRARALFSGNPNGALNAPPRRRAAVAPRARRAVHWAAALLVVATGLALAAYPRSRPPGPEPATQLSPVAEHLPVPLEGLPPQGVWLVDSGEDWELFSNGLRIDTTYAVAGEPRRYRSFSLDGEMGEVLHRPSGLVYHTSESDIWPLKESFNEKLRDSSQNLLRYLRRRHVYHYLVDRFGQAFRVVEEADRANHAGMSIWRTGERVWLNLNGPTIGICFETRWEGGRALPITRAQLEAGRRLTDYLRDKWSIAPEMCVTHGLVSVNARRHLIGHHVDWARGFPFEAFGLPDLYGRPAPAVALFGFDHDEQFLEVMGEPWPGVLAAERELAEEAVRTGRTVEDVRRERSKRYDGWLARHARDAEESAEQAGAAATRRASTH